MTNEQEMGKAGWEGLDVFLVTLMGPCPAVCNLGLEQLTNALIGNKSKQ